MRVEPKPVAASQTMLSQIMLPDDANPGGNVHGGTIMKLVDTAAGVCAIRHCRSHVVTARMDGMNFVAPVHIGDVVTLKASINQVFHTSMEVGVRVEAENPLTGVVRHVASAYLIFVAVNEQEQPIPAPPLRVESGEQRARMRAAEMRREARRSFAGKVTER